jgi:hypothetical protein
MRQVPVAMGFFLAAAFPIQAPAHAENWKFASTNKMASYYVDLDSIKLNPDGSTYFRGRSSPHIITEVEVRCDQDFSKDKFSMRERTYSYDGIRQDDEWDAEESNVRSLIGQSVRFVCHK